MSSVEKYNENDWPELRPVPVFVEPPDAEVTESPNLEPNLPRVIYGPLPTSVEVCDDDTSNEYKDPDGTPTKPVEADKGLELEARTDIDNDIVKVDLAKIPVPIDGQGIGYALHASQVEYSTLGLSLRHADKTYLLSAGHGIKLHDFVNQLTIVGKCVFTAVKIDMENDTHSLIDCSLCQVPKGLEIPSTLPTGPGPNSGQIMIRKIFDGDSGSLRNKTVYKVGASSGYTEGVITDTKFVYKDVSDDNPGCVILVRIPVERGDSGSVIMCMDQPDMAVAMIYGTISVEGLNYVRCGLLRDIISAIKRWFGRPLRLTYQIDLAKSDIPQGEVDRLRQKFQTGCVRLIDLNMPRPLQGQIPNNE